MATRLERHWAPSLDAPARRDQRGGRFRAYQPDELRKRPVVLDAQLAARASEVERAVRELTVGSESAGLESLARFLLRSEAIASSRIEGLQVYEVSGSARARDPRWPGLSSSSPRYR